MQISFLRTLPFLSVFLIALISCGQQEPQIDFGKAECAHCRMNVVDRQFAAVLITEKGRQYAFDDISCMVEYLENGTVAADQVAGLHVCDHAAPGRFIDATTAFYLHGAQFRSPMRGDMAAFATKEARSAAKKDDNVELDWSGVKERSKK